RYRRAYDHKGTFGHALLVAGSYGKIGAAVMAARALLRSGAGLVSVHLPRCGYEIMQISFPEAMCTVDPHKYVFSAAPDNLDPYQAIGVGPGLGQDQLTGDALAKLLERAAQPLVIDADALNLLSQHPEWWEWIPKNSILTPHPKEFERLFGKADNDFARLDLQRERAAEHGCIIVQKTGHTTIAAPDGQLFFNSTGNPGMGTGGTGDVLTGILTGLLAQDYAPLTAACLGVYLHGLAGDLAAAALTQESLIAEDVIRYIGAAIRETRIEGMKD
ncbi:MAG: NAD(P)H-hydrate dehydratase, partial [Saprospiraceae bacterium]